MTPRHYLLLAGVLGAGALLLFGERQPVSEVAEAVERAVAPARQRAARSPAEPPVILALLPRSEVAGEDGDTFGGADGVFQSPYWTPPPPKMAVAAAPPPPPLSSAPASVCPSAPRLNRIRLVPDRTLICRLASAVLSDPLRRAVYDAWLERERRWLARVAPSRPADRLRRRLRLALRWLPLLIPLGLLAAALAWLWLER